MYATKKRGISEEKKSERSRVIGVGFLRKSEVRLRIVPFWVSTSGDGGNGSKFGAHHNDYWLSRRD